MLFIGCHYAECCYAEGHDLYIAMLNVVLKVGMLSVVMLNVMAPTKFPPQTL